jgi:hypothetical protein
MPKDWSALNEAVCFNNIKTARTLLLAGASAQRRYTADPVVDTDDEHDSDDDEAGSQENNRAALACSAALYATSQSQGQTVEMLKLLSVFGACLTARDGKNRCCYGVSTGARADYRGVRLSEIVEWLRSVGVQRWLLVKHSDQVDGKVGPLSALEIALKEKMLLEARFSLRHGGMEPLGFEPADLKEDRTIVLRRRKALIAAAGDCPKAKALVCAALGKCSPNTHWLFPERARTAVRVVLTVAQRLGRLTGTGMAQHALKEPPRRTPKKRKSKRKVKKSQKCKSGRQEQDAEELQIEAEAEAALKQLPLLPPELWLEVVGWLRRWDWRRAEWESPADASAQRPGIRCAHTPSYRYVYY